MRQRAFRGPDAEALYQRAGNWLLATIYQNEKAAGWCKANGVVIAKAASEGIGSSGGFLVPRELSNAILDIRDAFGAFRRRALVVPMASDNTHISRYTGGASAYFIGEGSTATETQASPDQIGLTAKKIGSLVKVSSEVEEDAIVDVVDFVANEVGWAFAAQEDDCAFNGDGTSTYGKMTGVGKIVLDGNHGKAKVTAASGHNTYATLDTSDLGALMGSVRASAYANAAWFCSQVCFGNTFCRLSGTAGGGYLETRTVDGVDTPFYLGYPVIFTQKLPQVTSTLSGKVMLAFGDMYAAGVLGQRRGITLARSADRYMDSDQIAVLATERFHTVLHDLGDNTNFGSLAALVGN
ncbi:phage major capsid protein [Bradyrhizobium elkanii]|uniref:phage major capsid protein n=1 Tax=Bradyrhizobium elkanii TaxID=29448 RepID=UPI002166D129|nr:phage major capsid protein [Bradyrhizobium elkanii]MCS3690938.1 HK97 family phage major capsid protein [Bradyrhizobium elkanii]